MRVISANVNGIRAAAKKGFFDWINATKPDVVCLQEVRAHEEQLDHKIYFPKDYYYRFFSAQKKGYSGVAIYSKTEPDSFIEGLGFPEADMEGRYLQFNFGNLAIASVYLPSGTTGDIRQDIKYKFLDNYLEILKKQVANGRDYIICGDFNIVHTEMDIKNWKSNQNTSGCLPEERAWLDKLFYEVGFIDAYRHKNPDKIEYTWWSNRGQAYNNNVGWRIDYQVITPRLANNIKSTEIYRDQKFSDHAPLIIEYNDIKV